MRRPFADWHPETFVCSFNGHDTPAATVARLRAQDAGLGVDLDDGRRFVRCIRCDVWLPVHPPGPGEATAETLPPLAQLEVPKRGAALRDSLILKLIALDRALHAVLFTMFALLLIYVDRHLGGFRANASALLNAIQSAVGNTGQGTSHNFIIRQLQRALNLQSTTLTILVGTSAVYAVVETIEAVGLWTERRWAEYLTAVATAGFIPFEVSVLLDHVTAIRLATLILNAAILIWLVWRKRLFGIRGGPARHVRQVDPVELFGPKAAALVQNSSPG